MQRKSLTDLVIEKMSHTMANAIEVAIEVIEKSKLRCV